MVAKTGKQGLLTLLDLQSKAPLLPPFFTYQPSHDLILHTTLLALLTFRLEPRKVARTKNVNWPAIEESSVSHKHLQSRDNAYRYPRSLFLLIHDSLIDIELSNFLIQPSTLCYSLTIITFNKFATNFFLLQDRITLDRHHSQNFNTQSCRPKPNFQPLEK